uniref:Natural cytotoxicity triggering receptor 3 n=1 Tax=Leptobrachium leishanense TaxID=445787 RepID=A0A8C5PZ40_9ANUR
VLRMLMFAGIISLLRSIKVSQSRIVNASEGDSVTLECSYNINSSNSATIGWYKWYRHLVNGEQISNTTGNFKGRVSITNSSEFLEKSSASIVLHNVLISDTGIYICEVNISELSGHGNGTFLYVKGETIAFYAFLFLFK